MPVDVKASASWNRAAHAYSHYVRFIAAKPRRLELSFTDLVYVKNFKGGSAIIGESPATLPAKLTRLSEALADADSSGDLDVPLGNLAGRDLQRAKERMMSFVAEAMHPATRVNGFGQSFASAMLHFYFPSTVPILDRRVLNGARIPGVKLDKQGQVVNLVGHYPALVEHFAYRLRENTALTLRELDRELFVEKLANRMPAR